MKSKVLISSGGSGGHVLPAMTIYDHLKFSFETFISTDNRGLKYLDKDNYKIIIIDTPKLNNIFLLPFKIFKVLFLTIKSLIILKKEKFSILISTGGYMSLPLCLAARILNIKIFLFEPNMVLGRSNRFFLNFSNKLICYSKNLINLPKKFEKKLTVINPLIRKKYYEMNKFKKDNDVFTILIIGGSQGANIFDNLINEVFTNVSTTCSLKVIHQTSHKNINLLKNFYNENEIENHVFTFDKNINNILAQTDLCITRAGASSLAEISFLKIPFIAIPLPSAMDNHQYENAKFYRDKNCCWIIKQNDFDKQEFEKLLIKLSSKRDEYYEKKINLEKLNYQNTWNNVNQNLLEVVNEN